MPWQNPQHLPTAEANFECWCCWIKEITAEKITVTSFNLFFKIFFRLNKITHTIIAKTFTSHQSNLDSRFETIVNEILIWIDPAGKKKFFVVYGCFWLWLQRFSLYWPYQAGVQNEVLQQHPETHFLKIICTVTMEIIGNYNFLNDIFTPKSLTVLTKSFPYLDPSL